jgi:hypothetical protein
MRLWKKPWSILSAKSAKTGGRLKDLPNTILGNNLPPGNVRGQFGEMVVETEEAGLLEVVRAGMEVTRPGKLRTNEIIPGCQKPLNPK